MAVSRSVGQLVAGATALVLVAGTASAQYRFTVQFENGGTFTSSNDVRIPGDTGTQFSLTDDLTTEHTYYWRVRAEYRPATKHVISVLVAPLTLKAAGTINRAIAFNGDVFGAGVPLEASYRFNSYRLTYRYEFVQGERWRFGIGATAKIRDAYTRLEGGGVTSTKTNVGFVPLVNFKLQRLLSSRASLVLEGDALAAPQGRAEDVLVALQLSASPKMSFQIGYRILEGGADVTEVYTFTLVNYLAIGAVVRF
jgi:hypothetical protein